MKFPGAYRLRKLGEDAAPVGEAGRIRLRMLLAGCGGALVMLLIGGIWQSMISAETDARVAQLEVDNIRLAEELGVSRLALEMERATSSGLERQLSELNAALMKRQAELEFLRQQASPQQQATPPRKAAPPRKATSQGR